MIVNDTDLNITWLANANLALSNTFGVGGINTNGIMSWNTAQSWIGAMNTANYLGYNDWRLPTVTDTGAPGCDFAFSGTDCGYNVETATSEMLHLFYDELGNKAYCDTSGNCPQPGFGLTNAGPFSNLENYGYWSGTEYALDTGHAWYIYFSSGEYQDGKDGLIFAMAVRPGQVAAVPEPATAWLIGAGLIGLMGVARRRLTLR